MHVVSKPSILYFGTPVALLSTLNEDGTANLAPMSSTIFVSWRCLLGLQANSKTVENLRRTGEMVINTAAVHQVSAVDKLGQDHWHRDRSRGQARARLPLPKA